MIDIDVDFPDNQTRKPCSICENWVDSKRSVKCDECLKLIHNECSVKGIDKNSVKCFDCDFGKDLNIVPKTIFIPEGDTYQQETGTLVNELISDLVNETLISKTNLKTAEEHLRRENTINNDKNVSTIENHEAEL